MVLKLYDNSAKMSENYRMLKTEVLKSILTSPTLPTDYFEILLSRYKEVIASDRTLSRLRQNRNLHDLLVNLEQRDFLSNSDWSGLTDICHVLNCQSALNVIDHYKKLWNPTLNLNCNICGRDESQAYVKQVSPALVRRRQEESPTSSRDLDVAIERISRRLGRSWKDLARTKEFGFNEYDIEGFEEDHKRMADQIRYMFREWREQEGNKATVPKLITALKKARRTDLAELCG